MVRDPLTALGSLAVHCFGQGILSHPQEEPETGQECVPLPLPVSRPVRIAQGTLLPSRHLVFMHTL